jgi:hypothetical protein
MQQRGGVKHRVLWILHSSQKDRNCRHLFRTNLGSQPGKADTNSSGLHSQDLGPKKSYLNYVLRKQIGHCQLQIEFAVPKKSDILIK